MINYLIKHSPRWFIFGIDISICLISIVAAYYIRFNFELNQFEKFSLQKAIPLVILIRALTFYIWKLYAGIVRYTSTKDVERIFVVVLIGTISFIGFNFVSSKLFNGAHILPFGIVVIDFLLTIFLMSSFRVVTKILYLEISNPTKFKEEAIIYGISELGVITKRTLDRDETVKHKAVAFVDDEANGFLGKKLEGIQIYHFRDLEKLINNYPIKKLILAKKNISADIKPKIIEICADHKVEILNVPEVDKWMNGVLSASQIKNFKVEDLLGREPIVLDKQNISDQLNDKNVLVTGAAGSIGSELVKQIISFSPRNIILFDQAETPLYEIELEIREKFKFRNYSIVIGSVTHQDRVKFAFEKYRPDVVFHAAAYKHVPMMENNPWEAISTNVFGTKNVADISVEYGIKEFIMVSTDKAVNPTNVMGASKRIAEIYTQSLNGLNDTRFITTRFGNVLGSNGSVIPRFRKQIEEGGPITVTHPEITRYFMTIPEACQLVLEAGSFGKGGEIFVFDMGEPVKIVDLAKNMIKLSGLKEGIDIGITFSGLRPGEKLYEELLNSKENTLPTHHPQIMIGKVREFKYSEVIVNIKELENSLISHDIFKIVEVMKNIVPEYKSENSVFEKLDCEKSKDKNKLSIKESVRN